MLETVSSQEHEKKSSIDVHLSRAKDVEIKTVGWENEFLSLPEGHLLFQRMVDHLTARRVLCLLRIFDL